MRVNGHTSTTMRDVPVGQQRGAWDWATLLALSASLLAVGACSGVTDARGVSRIAVTPPSVDLLVADQTTLQATVTDASGHILTGSPVFWSTEDGSIATVSAAGVVTAAMPGRVRIAASSGGVAGIGVITVSPIVVASVIVEPQSLTVAQGATAQLRAVAYDAAGHVVRGVTAVWGSSNQDVAAVDTSGVVSGVGAGTTTVTAAISGQLASATVDVPSPPPPPHDGGG